LKAGEPLEARFTVRTCKITPLPEYGAKDVRRVRDLLAMSQAAFAAFLGVEPSTVRSREQGIRPPSLLACLILSEIEADPGHWHKRLAAIVGAPKADVSAAKHRRRSPTRTPEKAR
jgi:DNA-binding transcriptional regulator YiaG